MKQLVKSGLSPLHCLTVKPAASAKVSVSALRNSRRRCSWLQKVLSFREGFHAGIATGCNPAYLMHRARLLTHNQQPVFEWEKWVKLWRYDSQNLKLNPPFSHSWAAAKNYRTISSAAWLASEHEIQLDNMWIGLFFFFSLGFHFQGALVCCLWESKETLIRHGLSIMHLSRKITNTYSRNNIICQTGDRVWKAGLTFL